MISIKLLLPRLEYISLGTETIHARETGAAYYNPDIDLSARTLCGRIIPPGTKPQETRQVGTRHLCGRCYQSLRTFRAGIEAVQGEDMA